VTGVILLADDATMKFTGRWLPWHQRQHDKYRPRLWSRGGGHRNRVRRKGGKYTDAVSVTQDLDSKLQVAGLKPVTYHANRNTRIPRPDITSHHPQEIHGATS
jgi:hypothetical protein